MTSAMRSGDSLEGSWPVDGDYSGSAAVVVLRRRRMGKLDNPLAIVGQLSVSGGVTTVTAPLPAELATGEYAVTLQFTDGATVTSAPAASNHSLTVWPSLDGTYIPPTDDTILDGGAP